MSNTESGARRAPTMKPLAVLAAVAATLLAGCGGGGGGGGTAYTPNTPTGPSENSAGMCVAPRPATSDRAGTVDDEKRFVGAWNNETYLWYREVNDPGPASYPSAVSYFDVLKTNAITASGNPKDKFHFTYDTAEWVALSQSGSSVGYGFNLTVLAVTPPRRAVVAYTDPGTPAAAQNIGRGAEVLSVDGVDFVNDPTQAGVNVINAGLFPAQAGQHTFRIREANGTTRTVSLNASQVTSVPVQNTRTLPAPNQNVGYLQFNDHIATSEQQLIAAITTLRTAGVSDLVLDLRYNGGGYLDIASELAYMIAAPRLTLGKVFEELQFNDKNPFGLTTAERRNFFHTTTQGFSTTEGVALPTLGLERVYVLTGGDTCSASEAIVNGLRGAGVNVVLVGNTTCGKPYGFYPRDNCGTTYFTVQFQGVNDQGIGDYADGFTPTPGCEVPDDFTRALGNPAEARLAAALRHRNTGSCQGTSGASRDQIMSVQNAAVSTGGTLVRTPARQNRFYR